MGIKVIKRDVKPLHRISFDWIIPDYCIDKNYEQTFERDGTKILLRLKPEYEKGVVYCSNPHAMFLSYGKSDMKKNRKIKFSARAYSFPVRMRNFQKFQLNEPYHTYSTFLRSDRYERALREKSLDIAFEFEIIDDGYPGVGTFDSSKLTSDFLNLFAQQRFTDCQLIVGEKSIGAHKWLLGAVSPALREALDASNGQLTVENCSYEGAYEFLKYMYSEEFQHNNIHIIFEVIALAELYKVPRLKDECEKMVLDCIESSDRNLIFQNCFKYNLSEKLKVATYRSIQRIFLGINQKLPDEFINDPAHIDQLITMAEALIDAIHKKVVKEVPVMESDQQDALELAEAERVHDAKTDDPAGAEADVLIETVEICENNLNETLSETNFDKLDYEEFQQNISHDSSDTGDMVDKILNLTDTLDLAPYTYTLEDIVEEDENSSSGSVQPQTTDENVSVCTAVAEIQLFKIEPVNNTDAEPAIEAEKVLVEENEE